MNRITNSTEVEHMATSADFTVADVLAWARTKPADEAYRYVAGVWSETEGGCALCHFLKDTRRAERPCVWPRWHENGDGQWADDFGPARYAYPADLEAALRDGGTFGGLAKMLEALCPEMAVTPSAWAAIDAYLSDIEQVEQVSA